MPQLCIRVNQPMWDNRKLVYTDTGKCRKLHPGQITAHPQQLLHYNGFETCLSSRTSCSCCHEYVKSQLVFFSSSTNTHLHPDPLAQLLGGDTSYLHGSLNPLLPPRLPSLSLPPTHSHFCNLLQLTESQWCENMALTERECQCTDSTPSCTSWLLNKRLYILITANLSISASRDTNKQSYEFLSRTVC